MKHPKKPRASDFPVTREKIRRGRIERAGARRRDLLAALELARPDYVSKSGKVKRWKALPTLRYGVFGHSAADLCVKPWRPGARCQGTAEFIRRVLQDAVRNWFRLTPGREIEETAALLMDDCDRQGPALPFRQEVRP